VLYFFLIAAQHLDQLEWIIDVYNTRIRHGLRLWGLHKNLVSNHGSLLQLMNLVDPKPRNRDSTLLLQTPLPPRRNFTNRPLHEHRLLLFEEKIPAHTFLREVRHKGIVGTGVWRQEIMRKHIAGIIRSLRLLDIVMVGCLLFFSLFIDLAWPGSDAPDSRGFQGSELCRDWPPPLIGAYSDDMRIGIRMNLQPPYSDQYHHATYPYPRNTFFPKHTAPDGFSPVAQIDWTTARER
jgi:hypothetical protein